ncbi:MAG: DEAD/DEAH box helicase [Myxococcales bacterium]|nr:DEAD/DEAH box helicase [Myxococcales bacterium]
MEQLSLESAGDDRCLVARLTPAGCFEVRTVEAGPAPLLPARLTASILEAFAQGQGRGVLHLGAANLSAELPPSLAFLREVGKGFVARVCGALDPTDPGSLAIPGPDPEELSALADSAPPMQGGELLNPARLAALWGDLATALTDAARVHKDGVQGYLRAHDSVWNVVGRVCLHLAENKRDPELPFAFLATYVHKVSRQARPQHLPLGQALQQYAGARNRQKLLALLSPLSRAAEHSELVAELVASGDIYHPLSWTPAEAHRFLREVALLEQAGLVVRLPDWWSAKNPPRPQVTVSVGTKAPSSLGMEALLSFDVQLSLDGKKLGKREIDALLGASEGLVLIKGRWVEVDAEQLAGVLTHWQTAQQRAREHGISFAEAMRTLAGASLAPQDDALSAARPQWSEVVAGKWLASKLEALRSTDAAPQDAPDSGLRAELRPYQQNGVHWLRTLQQLQLGGCLADDMGLGKTIQVLALFAANRRDGTQGTDLLVVPASLIDNWCREAERFAPELKLLVAHTSRLPAAELKALSKQRVAAHHAVITTYGSVSRVPWLKNFAWRNVVLDEAQAIKNPAAGQTRAVKALHSQWRLALTGTPIENRLGDLWSLFDFLNPGLLGSAKDFGDLCKSMASAGHGYAPLRRLVQPYILRRLKTDKRVIDDLPDKTEVTAHCLMSKRQAALYQRSVDELEHSLRKLDGIKRRANVLSFLMRFKQICNHPSQWLGDGEYEAADSGKMQRLREICEPIAARQQKLLLFTQFREMTAPLASHLSDIFGGSGLVLHGATPVKKRQLMVERFQADPEIPFMVLSLKAGGTGLNLTAASHVVHFDRWWNPAVEDQATDRAFRIGQKNNVLVHKFVCRGTVEERIDGMIAAKRQLSSDVLGAGAETAVTEMSDEDLLDFVSLDLKRAIEG